MLSSNGRIRSLSEKKSYLRDHFYCTEIGLFGSFATNEETDLSNIDILVVFEPETPNLYNVELELKEYLKKCSNREIDICSKKWIRPILKSIVLKEAIYAE